MNLSSSLTTLSLRSCYLRGKLENNILCLPSIQTLDLGYNLNLEGSLPNSNCNSSSSLKFLDLSSTSFLGELTDSIGSLKSLKHLNLYSCNFTGSIPTSLGSLTQITHLILSLNNFTGPIPTSLGSLTQITYLDLHENKFTGSIPSSLGNLTQITYLDLSYNSFRGEILLPLLNFRCFWHRHELTISNYWWIFQQVCCHCHYWTCPISQLYTFTTINLLVPFLVT